MHLDKLKLSGRLSVEKDPRMGTTYAPYLTYLTLGCILLTRARVNVHFAELALEALSSVPWNARNGLVSKVERSHLPNTNLGGFRGTHRKQ